jgi:topoisomerase-4 subunit A
VEASKVALANVKLYMNREDGFIGTGLRKDEFVCDCSDLDEVIVFREDGKFNVSKVAEKTFAGKGIVYAQVFKKNDERTVYNLIYRDGVSGTSYIKRFSVLGVTRDKEYDLTKGGKGSRVLYFTANPNGEAEIINVQLKPHSKLKKLQFDLDFADQVIKGRSSMGNIVTKYPVKKVLLKSKGLSTLSGRKIWYDDVLKRLNVDRRGKYLGEFDGDDRILTLNSQGIYELSSFDLSNHFDDKLLIIEKFNSEKVFTSIYLEGKSGVHYLKRFVFENASIGKKSSIISEEPGSKLILISGHVQPKIRLDVLKGKTKIAEESEIDLSEVIEVKGMKAMGNRLTPHEVKEINLLPSTIEEDEEILAMDSEPNQPVDDTDTSVTSRARDIDIEMEPAMGTEVNAKEPLSETESMQHAESDEEIVGDVTEVKLAVEQDAPIVSEEPPKEEIKPANKIDFEITNTDDPDADDKGQLGLF